MNPTNARARRRALMTASLLVLLVTAPVVAYPAQDHDSATWQVVTFTGRITQADLSAVEAAGATELQYLPDDSYVGWMTGSTTALISSLGSVRQIRPLATSEKIHSHLPSDGELRLHVLAHTQGLGGTLRSLGSLGQIVAVRGQRRPIADVFMNGGADDLSRIASNKAVRYVGPAASSPEPLDETSAQINAGNINGTAPTVGYEPWLAGLGLDGSGVRVTIVDTGIDARHPDLAERVVAKVDYSQSPSGEPLDTGGHGTHVAGIIGGDGTGLPPVAGRVKDANGFLYGLGVAPKVQFVDQNIIATSTPWGANCSGGWEPTEGWPQLTKDSLANNAAIWNASWRTCEGAGIGYVESSAGLDALVLDGDPAKDGAQPFTMVFAAGNAGSGPRTIEAPSEAKNTIVVGASNNSRAGSINSLASFSSRGPAVDGRILPTISAPGASIVSSRAQNPAVACNTPTTDGFGLYASCSGTSMASPHVAGSVALITQWWRRSNEGADASPAMSKALLINTATDMGAKDIPNGNEGWGRVNLGNLFDPSAQRLFVDETVALSNLGQTHSLNVTPADTSKPMKVTLVWTDPAAAAGSEPALVNDLDLTVTDPSGISYPGNSFSQGVSIFDFEHDRLNNMENVFLPSASGSYRIDVSAFNLPGDGIPFSGDETDQKFALVVSNAVLA